MGGKGSGAKKIDPEIRFFALVQVNDCWDWQGRKTPDNYGRFWDGYKLATAHRWVYEYLTQTVLGELTIDHLCRNRLCMNPDHMEPVTDEENRNRGGCRFASRIAQQRRTQCIRGHAYTPENTKIHGINERTCRTCQRMKRREMYHRTKTIPVAEADIPTAGQARNAWRYQVLTEERDFLQAMCAQLEAYANVTCVA